MNQYREQLIKLASALFKDDKSVDALVDKYINNYVNSPGTFSMITKPLKQLGIRLFLNKENVKTGLKNLMPKAIAADKNMFSDAVAKDYTNILSRLSPKEKLLYTGSGLYSLVGDAPLFNNVNSIYAKNRVPTILNKYKSTSPLLSNPKTLFSQLNKGVFNSDKSVDAYISKFRDSYNKGELANRDANPIISFLAKQVIGKKLHTIDDHISSHVLGKHN